MKRSIPVAVGVVAFSVMAGCGGGDGTSSADFVADGNQICREDNAKFKELGSQAPDDVRDYLNELLPLAEEDLSRLQGLEPPSDKADLYDAWISDLEDGTALTERASDAPSSDAATKILESGASISKQADAEARELGLDECLSAAGEGTS